MKDLQETIKEVDLIISWWLSLKQGYNNLNKLDYTLQKLSGHYYYLCELTAQSYKDYLFSYVGKKVGLAKREQAIINEGGSATLAKQTAPLHEEMLLMEEAEREGDYNTLKLKLSAVSKVLEAIRQRIANLKIELNNA
jgi:hypothetical protein